jgi:tripartite-type tricarboxylate transporter receptor subunit TctC
MESEMNSKSAFENRLAALRAMVGDWRTSLPRCLVALAAVVLSQAHAQDPQAQTYPNRSIRLVVPVTAGSGTDAMARYVASGLGKAWNTTVIVDNKPGAGVIVGTDFVAKAPPDGYTLLFTYAAHYSQPWTMPTPYDPIKDFEAIAQLANSKLIFATKADSPFRNVQDVIAAARQKPGVISYASAGVGTTGHMAGALFASMAGIELNHVPYKSAAQVPLDASSGQVDVMFGGLPSALPLIKSGRLRVLAVTALSRSGNLPDAPTISESGLPGFDNSSPIWVFAPRGTPAAIVAKLSDALNRLASTAEFREYCLSQGVDADVLDAAQTAARAPKELAIWKRMVALTNPSSK